MMHLPRLLLSLTCLAACACSASESNTSAQSFWTSFRQAVSEGSRTKAAQLTRFPLEVRGVSDDDPVVKCDRACFDSTYEKLVNQKVYLPKGDDVVEKTMRQLILDQPTLRKADQSGQSSFRFQQFQFELTTAGWRLVTAYLEEEE
jgi:hypothetical protein